MNKVFLKSLRIKDFKGIEELSINFDNTTTIKGDNGLGKTSIFDAFTWLLFDKDSKNRATFDIKPLDSNNQVVRGLTPTVTGVFEICGQAITLSKTYKEKWTKKRGEAEATFTGNETNYEINDVPVKKKDYVSQVGEMVDEEQFKLLSNPYYFSDNLNWKDARKVILEIAGDVSVEEVVQAEPKIAEIVDDIIAQGEMLQKSKKATVAKLTKEKKEIPVRINEIKNSYVDIDFEKLEQDRLQLEKELEDTDIKIKHEIDKMNNTSKVNEDVHKQITELESQQQSIKSKAMATYNDNKNALEISMQELKHKLYSTQKDKQYDKTHITEIERKILKSQEERHNLQEKYLSIQAETPTLDEIQKQCPTCKREFTIDYISEMEQQIIENFNQQKAKKLENIKNEGLSKKSQIDKFNNELKEVSDRIEVYDKSINDLEVEIRAVQEDINNLNGKEFMSVEDINSINRIENNITDLREKLVTNIHTTDTLDTLNRMKDLINNKISDVKAQISQKDYNKQLDNRIEELLLTEKNIGCKIAQFEKQLMLCELFIRTRVNLLETGINAKFKHVSFKMFKEQVNGALDETCEALINGVPFSMANTASQINAGLDIINTLSKFYEVQVPVFIDNSEAVNDILRVDSQVIKLEVSKNNKLIVEGE